uniref:Uncharacterized protein n=1 Tax=Onchocerca volvulus TaxID=6282 RepID=A0A8R1U263_ONCVO
MTFQLKKISEVRLITSDLQPFILFHKVLVTICYSNKKFYGHRKLRVIN